MNASDAAGSDELDPDPSADRERPADRRCPEPAANAGDCQIARPDLAGLSAGGCKPLQFARREPNQDLAVDDADRRRHGARLAYGSFRFDRDVEPCSFREPVRHECRLEANDRCCLAVIELGLRNLGTDLDHGVAPRLETARAAVSSASSTPPTR